MCKDNIALGPVHAMVMPKELSIFWKILRMVEFPESLTSLFLGYNAWLDISLFWSYLLHYIPSLNEELMFLNTGF
jgi:hypothetical protein